MKSSLHRRGMCSLLVLAVLLFAGQVLALSYQRTVAMNRSLNAVQHREQARILAHDCSRRQNLINGSVLRWSVHQQRESEHLITVVCGPDDIGWRVVTDSHGRLLEEGAYER